jgi:hypothetical protein
MDKALAILILIGFLALPIAGLMLLNKEGKSRNQELSKQAWIGWLLSVMGPALCLAVFYVENTIPFLGHRMDDWCISLPSTAIPPMCFTEFLYTVGLYGCIILVPLGLVLSFVGWRNIQRNSALCGRGLPIIALFSILGGACLLRLMVR